jgi:hypothetical protein
MEVEHYGPNHNTEGHRDLLRWEGHMVIECLDVISHPVLASFVT